MTPSPPVHQVTTHTIQPSTLIICLLVIVCHLRDWFKRGRKGAKRGCPTTTVRRMKQEPEVVPDDAIRQAMKTMQETLPTIVTAIHLTGWG